MKKDIDNIIKESLRAGDKDKLNLFRVLKGEISRMEDGKNELSKEDIIKIIQKIVKNLESIGDDKSKKEIDMLTPFLPQQLTEEEIEKIIQSIVITNNYSTMKDMGKIMGDFNRDHGGSADNKIVAQVVKKILT